MGRTRGRISASQRECDPSAIYRNAGCMTRRETSKGGSVIALLAAAAMMTASAASAASGDASPARPRPAPDAIEVAPGVHLLRGAFVPGSQPDGNTVILKAPDGLIVIDTGRHAAHTQRI